MIDKQEELTARRSLITDASKRHLCLLPQPRPATTTIGRKAAREIGEHQPLVNLDTEPHGAGNTRNIGLMQSGLYLHNL